MSKYPKSIITHDLKHCYLCGSSNWIEIHHIFGGSNRKHSTKYGLVVPLCHYCHNEPPNGVHFNKERMTYLRKIGQKAFEVNYPEENFLKIFHRNYLDEEEL